ncbi:CHASE3 domain-containing protein [Acidipila rosea]|uniref:CHASE3 domain-containing protein n=1 Tax=Acidipila rosea TaxID=768535 RepID=UPI00104AC7F6|nr:CHASE3 domain-containing protein [Acidipila rosea]
MGSVLTMTVLAACLVWQVTVAQTARRWLSHSDRVTTSLDLLQKLIDDQETSLRGYQLTGDPQMLDPFKAANNRIEPLFGSLHQAIADNPKQSAGLTLMQERYERWLAFAQKMLTENPAGLRDPQLNEQGKILMDQVRAAAFELQSREAALRRQRYDDAQREERRTLRFISLGGPLAGLLLGLFMVMRLRAVSRAYSRSAAELEHRAQELHTGREWLQTTLESIGDAVIACDSEGNVDFLNAVAQKLTGWTATEAKGKPLTTVFHIVNEETRAVCENPVDKVRRLNTVVGLANHTVLISKDGREYVIDDSASPIRGDDDRMLGVVLVFRDVTELRRTEAALLANEKLAIAGRLAASIAHEIHNPLDSIANLLYLIKDEKNSAKSAEYLGFAQQELDRVMQISRTMLSLYREPSSPAELDLRELLESVLLLLDRRLAEQHIVLVRDFPERVIIQGFPGELRQVLTNVIVNAAEASGAHGRIAIRLESVPPEEFRGAGAVIEVRDSGAGIEEGAAASLFQPFFTTKGERGTGLGLWVSLGIVQKHGGTMRIMNSTAPDYPGALVRIFLPTRTMATSMRRNKALKAGPE